METIVITGANRGIGLALARRFLQEGKDVIATCRALDDATELRSLQERGNLSLYELDVTDNAAVHNVAETLSGKSIDVLINNAGVMGPKQQSLSQMNYESWSYTFAVNAMAPFHLATSLLNNLKMSSNPRIITISSQMGSLNRKNKGAYAYRSSKAAVNKVMQVLATELEPENIIVCPVHPGWVKTDMGGAEADITVAESAAGLVNVINNLTKAQSGRFWTWQGVEHPW